MVSAFAESIRIERGDTIERTRKFYGVLSLMSVPGAAPAEERWALFHGSVSHGTQFRAPERQHEPTRDYGPESGVGLAVRTIPPTPGGRRIGVVGLGVGTLAAYGRSNDVFRL